jgi:hypothetical protein
MDNPKILIKQPAGIGDILFLQKLIYEIKQETGLEILYPLKSNLMYLKDYLESHVTFINEDEEFEYKNIYSQNEIIQTPEIYYYPIQHFNHMYNTLDIMKIKYEIFGKDWNNWSDYIKINRNKEREKKLWDYLDLEGKDYILINKNFGTPPDSLQIDIELNTNNHIVNMDYLGWDNLFDWIKVIENANEIHTVETSICYLIECFKLKTDKIFLYKRGNQKDFSYIEGIYKKFIKYE